MPARRGKGPVTGLPHFSSKGAREGLDFGMSLPPYPATFEWHL